jgi:tRNA(Ile)-lysidine synthase
MSPLVERDGLKLMRPLLGAPKASLLALLDERGQAWIDDPSNADDRYARVRMRKLSETLAAEGLTPKRLASTADAMARVRESLEMETARAMAAYVAFDPLGYCRFKREGLAEIPPEIALRLLRDMVMIVGGQSLPPRLDRLERLLYALLEGPVAVTVAGCRLLTDGIVCREARHLPPPLALVPGRTMTWDGRFAVRLGEDAGQGISVAALGEEGWSQLAERLGRDQLPRVPQAVRITAPALWRDDRLCAAPLLGYNGDIPASMTFLTRTAV